MGMDTNEMRNEFFKISLSEGHHNAIYSVMQIALMILSCVRGKESFEEGAKAPSAQTLRDRLLLDSEWLAYFHDCMWRLAKQLVRLLRHARWYISIDETPVPFFGNRKKLNAELVAKGLGKLIHGYRADTPGATGSFSFLVISLCCSKIRLPVAIKIVRVGEAYEPWLEPILQRLLALVPRAIALADRGFAYTQFFLVLERLKAHYIVRLPLHSKRVKRKLDRGMTRLQYWMTDRQTREKVLLTVRVALDSEGQQYVFATSEASTKEQTLLTQYGQRWDIENLFKDSNRVLLPTSSRNPLMRLYCIVLSFFLFALWQVSRFRQLIPRTLSLRSFVKCILAALCESLHCLISQLGIIVHQPP